MKPVGSTPPPPRGLAPPRGPPPREKIAPAPREIPAFDGVVGRTKPEPPKFIQRADGTLVKVGAQAQAAGHAGPSAHAGAKNPGHNSNSSSSGNGSSGSQFVSGAKAYGGGAVDSRSQAKGEYSCGPGPMSGPGPRVAAASSSGASGGPPIHTPSAAFASLPRHSTTAPRAFIPPPKMSYAEAMAASAAGGTGVGGMSARNGAQATGSAGSSGGGLFSPGGYGGSGMPSSLGSPKQRFVASMRVPYGDAKGQMQPDNLNSSRSPTAAADAKTAYDAMEEIDEIIASLGPENVVQQLTDLWCACFDDEAKAIYYYNNETGEATWVKPQLV